MSFEFECIFCRKKMTLQEEQNGTRVKCPGCGEMVFCVKHKEKNQSNAALAILAVVGGFFAIIFTVSSCINMLGQRSAEQSTGPVDYITPGRRHDETYSGSGSSSLITRSQVINETRKALDMAAKISGASYSGFTVDHCVIGTTKAVCHFSLREKGVQKTGAIEFNIQGASLIPSGKFYLE